MNKQIVDLAVENMLDSLDPAVANNLRVKYNEDAEAFSQAARDACPSTEPAYWAKKSCHKCYGRGNLGTRTVFHPNRPAKATNKVYTNGAFTLGVACSCTGKNYQKWLGEFRKFYLALKALMPEGT